MSYRTNERVTIEAIRRQISDIPDYLKPVLDYWQNLRGERLAPPWREFNMLALPFSTLPTTQVLDWFPEQGQFHFRYCGSGYASIHDVDLTGKSLMDIPFKELGEFLHKEYLSVVHDRDVNMVTYGYHDRQDFVEIETCLRLPLSDDGDSITGIIAVDVAVDGIADTRDVVEDMINRKINFRNACSPEVR